MNLMKPLTLFLLAIIFLNILAPLRAEERPAPTVTDLLRALIKANPKSIIGWEKIQGKNDVIENSTAIATLDKLGFNLIAKIVDEQTDYKCMVGQDYFIVIPKEKGLPPGGPIIKRTVMFPAATDVKSYEYLRQIEAGKGDKELFAIGPAGFYSPNHAAGVISMDGGSDFLYLVLNKIARKLSAKCWIVSDSLHFDLKTNEPIMPARLGVGEVAFFITAEHLPNDRLLPLHK